MLRGKMAHKILAVDDDELVLRSVKTLLGKKGWLVETCSNPLDALRKIRDERYDCLLLDVRMPQLSGTELLRRIRLLEAEGKVSLQQIIFLTGYADNDARQKALEFGVFNYVSKPFDADDLMTRLENCISASRLIAQSGVNEKVKDTDKSYEFILSSSVSDKASSAENESVSFESIGAKINVVSPEELFWWYAKTGFFYPSKKRKLTPYLPLVESSWKKALLLGEDVFWIATVCDEKTNSWASICNWRTTFSGWVSQHLIGTGHAAYPLMLMLATQLKVIDECKQKPYRSFQNWYRPTNKYANKVFGLLGASMNSDSRCVKEFSYYLIPKKKVSTNKHNFHVVACTNNDPRNVKEYLQDVCGATHCSAQEYDVQDIELKQLDEMYRKASLRRSRSFYIAYTPKGDTAGLLIANRGPVGINFSLIENTCELIIDKNLKDDEKSLVIEVLLDKLLESYIDFELPYVPLITDSENQRHMLSFGNKAIRTYDQFIWLESGFKDWYDILYGISKSSIARWKRYL